MKKLFGQVSNELALKLLKWSEFFYSFLIILPIIVLLYQDKGITIGDFFLIQGLAGLASFVLEIPSGYLSDTCSRRKVLILGACVFLFSNVWLYVGYGFWDIAIAEMGFGFSAALFSGTKESYAYDLLKRMKQEKEFLKENGALNSYSQAASFIASAIGGFIYAYIGFNIVLIEAITATIALVCVFMLPELGEIKRVRTRDTNALADVMSVVKMSMKHPEIKWFIIFPSVFGAFTRILLWMIQPTMEAAGIAVALFGIFVGFNQFMRFIFSKYAHAIFNHFETKSLLKSICAAVFITFIVIPICINLPLGAWTYIMITFICIWPAIQKLCALIFSSFIHERIKSNERGTVLSVNSMVSAFFSTLAMILMDPILDTFGLSGATLIAGALFLLTLIPLKKVLNLAK